MAFFASVLVTRPRFPDPGHHVPGSIAARPPDHQQAGRNNSTRSPALCSTSPVPGCNISGSVPSYPDPGYPAGSVPNHAILLYATEPGMKNDLPLSKNDLPFGKNDLLFLKNDLLFHKNDLLFVYFPYKKEQALF
jgi:hypothetical protein